MQRFKKLLFSFLMLVPTLMCWAQEAVETRPEMADVMRSNGKIYVVVAIVVMIFLGIIFYLLHIERKVKKLEDQWTNNK